MRGSVGFNSETEKASVLESMLPDRASGSVSSKHMWRSPKSVGIFVLCAATLHAQSRHSTLRRFELTAGPLPKFDHHGTSGNPSSGRSEAAELHAAEDFICVTRSRPDPSLFAVA